jgi:hypothetical protein
MARFTKIFATGKIGPVIFYEYRGKPVARSMPLRVRQTKATKESAKLFGRASSLSARLRSGLHDVLIDPMDKKMMYDLNRALLEWLQEPVTTNNDGIITGVPFLHDFNFTEAYGFSSRIKVPLQIDWTIPGKAVLTIPSLVPFKKDIVAPAHTQRVRLIITITGCEVVKKEITDHIPVWYTAEVNIPYNTDTIPTQQIELPFTFLPGSLYIVAAALRYTVPKKRGVAEVEDPRWLPAGIVDSAFFTE